MIKFRSTLVPALMLAAGLTVACSPDRNRTGAADRAREEADRADRAAPADMAADRTDTGITTSVKSRLAADQRLATLTEVSVETENGVVRLKGEVPTAEHKREAERIAKSVDGVKEVVNDLKVAANRNTR